MTLRRSLGGAVVLALVCYAIPKYGWPIVLDRARAQLVEATAVATPAPVLSSEPAPQEPWTGILLTPTVELSARLDAKLETVNVRVGDQVKAGDVLAQLDTTVQKHEVAAAEAALKASRAETWQASVAVAQAKDRQARRNGVVKVGGTEMAIASSEEQASAKFDSAAARGRLSSAAATAEERRAHVAQLRAFLEEATLRAPFDGTIAARYYEPGGQVRGGSSILRIVGGGSVRSRFAVPENETGRVQLGSRVALEWEGNRREAVVDRISPEIESASGTVFVEAALDNGQDKLDAAALSGRIIAVTLARRPPAAMPVLGAVPVVPTAPAVPALPPPQAPSGR